MAVNKNKRVATKHIRDGIKSQYKKGTCCEICGVAHELELHHYNTVSLLLKKYASENGIPISTDQEVLAMRDEFYNIFWHELVEDTVTLCHDHHVELHKVYSQEPPLSTANKQRNWVKTKHAKYSGATNISEPLVFGDISHFKVPATSLASFRV